MLFNSVYGKSSGGGGWKPGANTVAYYPLTSTDTVNDKSGNNRNLTNAGGATWETVGGVDCMYCNGNINGTGYVYTTSLPTSTQVTINVWAKANTGWSGTYARGIFDTYLDSNNAGIRWEFYSSYNYPVVYIGKESNKVNYTGINYDSIKLRNMRTITYDNTTHEAAIYKNSELYATSTLTSNYPSGNWMQKFSLGVGFNSSDSGINRTRGGWISAAIVENKVRTSDEITAYFEQTKDKYRPKWKPGENTLFYYPFKDDANDSIGNTTLSGGTYTKQTIGYLCAGSSDGTWNNINASTTIQDNLKTMLSWVYVVSSGTGNYTQILLIPNGNTCYSYYTSGRGNNLFLVYNSSRQYNTTSATLSTGAWHLLAVTVSDTEVCGYIDGVKYTIGNSGYYSEHTGIMLGRSGTQVIHSNVIGENRTWTADEIAGYYNQTKSKYGL